MEKKEYDILNLITQAQIGINWLYESTRSENSTQPFNELLYNFKKQNENIQIFNQGTVLMFAYVSLLLPKEQLFDEILNSKKIRFNVDKFEVKLGKKYNIIRGIRNALAHGNILIEGNYFIFKDKLPKAKEYHFIVKVSFADFGKLVSEFYYTMKKEYFESME